MTTDKSWLIKAIEEENARLGILPDDSLTAEKVQEMMLSDGIRPEDNQFSREIMRMRYGSEDN